MQRILRLREMDSILMVKNLIKNLVHIVRQYSDKKNQFQNNQIRIGIKNILARILYALVLYLCAIIKQNFSLDV